MIHRFSEIWERAEFSRILEGDRRVLSNSGLARFYDGDCCLGPPDRDSDGRLLEHVL